MAEKYIANVEGTWKAVCIPPDWCKVGKTVIPFDSYRDLSNEMVASPNVNARGTPVYRITDWVRGTDSNAGSGIISQTAQSPGHVHIIGDDTTVLVNGLICARHETLVEMNYGCGGPNTIGRLKTDIQPAVDSGPSFSDLAVRFGQGLWGAVKSVTVEPVLQVRDLGLAGASVFYNEVLRSDGAELWLPEMKSGVAEAAAAGVSQERLLLQSNPITGIGVASYDMTTAAMAGDWGTVAEGAGGVVGGLAIGKVAGGGKPAGTNGVKIKARARLPQDEAVNKKPPKAKEDGTIGKSKEQDAQLRKDIEEAKANDATDIRVNQQQVNAAGERVGINRPDLQYTDANGQRVYIEYDAPPASRAAGHEARILANDPNGNVILKTIP